MLSLYSSEFVRRNTWTCLSCSTLSRISPPHRLPATVPQRKHSSSKTPSSPKDESRAITTPSDTPSKDSKPAIKANAEKRPSNRISKRKSKDGILDMAGKGSNESTFNLPSVPKTNHLLAVGMASMASHLLRSVSA